MNIVKIMILGIISILFIELYAATPQVIMHAKVMCSPDANYQPKDADKPAKFQPYTSIVNIKKYKSGTKNCFVLVGYEPREKEIAIQSALALIDRVDSL